MWGTDTVEIAMLSPPHVKTQTNQSQTKPLSFSFSVFSHTVMHSGSEISLYPWKICSVFFPQDGRAAGRVAGEAVRATDLSTPRLLPQGRSLSLSLSLSLCVSLRSSHDSCGVGTLRSRSEHGNVQVFFPYTREEAGYGVNTTTEAEAEAEATSSSLLCAAGRRFARNDARPQSERKEW